LRTKLVDYSAAERMGKVTNWKLYQQEEEDSIDPGRSSHPHETDEYFSQFQDEIGDEEYHTNCKRFCVHITCMS
jgi:hypothetical protein